jgi:ABC-2 type transport system ATP-binding protein
VHNPEVLFLDEPTTGLDPVSRTRMWDEVRRLNKELGMTIFLTTQYLEEADALCDYISIIDRGKVVQQGTANQLKASLGRDVVEVHVAPADQEKAIELMKTLTKSQPKIDEMTRSISVRAAKGTDTLLKVVAAFGDAKIKIRDISVHRPSLDDVFLAVTGKKGRK